MQATFSELFPYLIDAILTASEHQVTLLRAFNGKQDSYKEPMNLYNRFVEITHHLEVLSNKDKIYVSSK